MPDMGVTSTLSNVYNSLPSLNPYMAMGGNGTMVDNSHNPAIVAAHPHNEIIPQPEEQTFHIMPYGPPSNPQEMPSQETPSGGWGMPSLGGMASGLGNALYNTGSAIYNSAPDLGISKTASNIYQSLPSSSSIASSAGNMLLGAAGAGASKLGSLAGKAATAGISAIPQQARSDLFENVGGKIGSGLGGAVSGYLPPSIGKGINDYTTNFGKKFGGYLSSQFSDSPQSSFGGFKNVASTLGAGAGGALGGAGLGGVGGSALGGYLGKKLGKYGAPIGKVLGGILGTGLGALAGGAGGGYLGNKFSNFERGGPVRERRSTDKLMYNGRNPRHGMPRRKV